MLDLVTALHGVALRLLSRGTRARLGAQLAGVFAEQAHEAARLGGRRAVARILVRELAALVRFAWLDRRHPPRRPRLDDRVEATMRLDRRTSVLKAIVQDLRYATRLLWRSPGFAAVCITTVALAIAANTAIFSVLHGVTLKALPFHAPDRLVVLGHHTNGGEALDSTTPGNLYDWMRSATAFEAVAGFSPTERIVTMGDSAERLRGGLAVGPLFEVLGRRAMAGRTLTAADDDPGAPRVVVLSAGLDTGGAVR